MNIVTIAIIIVAAFVAAVVRFAAHRGDPNSPHNVRDAVSLGLALLLYGLIIAGGPRLLGG